MKRAYWLTAAGSVALAVTLVGACSDDETGGGKQPTGENCAPTDPACPALNVDSDCLSLVDNSGKDVFAMRLAQLSITKPEALTSQIIYNLVADGVNVNLPACNVGGTGTFNLITVFDRAAGTIKAGGAYPLADPTDGYCFVDDPTHEVSPVEVPTIYNADGTFESQPIPRVVMPIFLDMAATTAVYLPLSSARIEGARISADNNCIGRFNADGLDPYFSCAPDPLGGIEYYINDGSLTGYITLEDADAVSVDLLKQSLCVVLSGDAATYGDDGTPLERCTRDGNGDIVLKGDWCAASNSAGGCQDSFRLQATIAASGAALAADCQGGPGGSGPGGSGPGGGGSGGAGGAGGAGGG